MSKNGSWTFGLKINDRSESMEMQKNNGPKCGVKSNFGCNNKNINEYLTSMNILL
jgi:hypothetical protein